MTNKERQLRLVIHCEDMDRRKYRTEYTLIATNPPLQGGMWDPPGLFLGPRNASRPGVVGGIWQVHLLPIWKSYLLPILKYVTSFA